MRLPVLQSSGNTLLFLKGKNTHTALFLFQLTLWHPQRYPQVMAQAMTQ